MKKNLYKIIKENYFTYTIKNIATGEIREIYKSCIEYD